MGHKHFVDLLVYKGDHPIYDPDVIIEVDTNNKSFTIRERGGGEEIELSQVYIEKLIEQLRHVKILLGG